MSESESEISQDLNTEHDEDKVDDDTDTPSAKPSILNMDHRYKNIFHYATCTNKYTEYSDRKMHIFREQIREVLYSTKSRYYRSNNILKVF